MFVKKPMASWTLFCFTLFTWIPLFHNICTPHVFGIIIHNCHHYTCSLIWHIYYLMLELCLSCLLFACFYPLTFNYFELLFLIFIVVFSTCCSYHVVGLSSFLWHSLSLGISSLPVLVFYISHSSFFFFLRHGYQERKREDHWQDTSKERNQEISN